MGAKRWYYREWSKQSHDIQPLKSNNGKHAITQKIKSKNCKYIFCVEQISTEYNILHNNFIETIKKTFCLRPDILVYSARTVNFLEKRKKVKYCLCIFLLPVIQIQIQGSV